MYGKDCPDERQTLWTVSTVIPPNPPLSWIIPTMADITGITGRYQHAV
jgi:hypothetical protein